MKQKGFTLIELVVVIVILGILAATALPKFVDLSTDAERAAAEGVAGALASASAINFGAAKLRGISGADVVPLNVANVCTDVILGPLMQGDVLPAGYTVGAGTGTCVTDETVVCTVTKGLQTISATIICAR